MRTNLTNLLLIIVIWITPSIVSAYDTQVDLQGINLERIENDYESDLYDSTVSVFSAYHNKLVLALFGQGAFVEYISPSVSSSLKNEISNLSTEELDYYVSPFSIKYSLIIGYILFGFYGLSAIYLLIVNSRFYFERGFALVTSNKNESGLKQVGGNHFLRFLLTVLVMTPVLPILFGDKSKSSFNLADGSQSSSASLVFFRVLGEFFDTTERVSRSFIGDSSIYSPHYFVPPPDRKHEEFDAILKFATCVANERSETSIEVKARVISSNGSGSYTDPSYVASYKNCHLQVFTKMDSGTISLLSDNDSLVKDSGISADEYHERLVKLFKEKIDSYLKTALSSTTKMSDKYYSINKADEKLRSHASLDLSEWYARCDDIKSKSFDDDYAVALNASRLLPYCFSQDFIKTFSYPKGVDDLDILVMDGDEITGSRYYPVCPTLGADEDSLDNLDTNDLSGCAKNVCNISDVGASGAFQCGAVIHSLASVYGIGEYASRGFLVAPSYNIVSLGVKGIDSVKDPVNRLTAIFRDVSPSSDMLIFDDGYTVFEHSSTRSKYKKIISDFEKTTSYTPPVESSVPQFSKYVDMGVSDILKMSYYKFASCLGRAGTISSEMGVCGTSYQELVKLLMGYVDYAFFTLMLSYKNKNVRDGTSNNGSIESGGKKKKGSSEKTSIKDKVKQEIANRTPNIIKETKKYFSSEQSKYLKTAMTVLGVGGLHAYVSDFELVDDLMSRVSTNYDLYNPEDYILSSGNLSTDVIGMTVMMISGTTSLHAFNVLTRYLTYGFITICTLVVFAPAIIFFLAMMKSILNLITFVITLPFQMASAFSDTGENASKNVKKLFLKWLLTMIRFPVTVIGFWLAFSIFDASITVFVYALDNLYVRAGETDMFVDIMVSLAWVVLYVISIYICLTTCMDTINKSYSIVRTFLMDQSDDVSSDDAMKAIKTVSSGGSE